MLRLLLIASLLLFSVIANKVYADEQPTEQHFLEETRAITQTISSVELYGVFVDYRRDFSYASYPNREHVFIRFVIDEQDGWAEWAMGYNKNKNPFPQRTKALDWYQELVGLTPAQAIKHIAKKRDEASAPSLENAELAIIDACGKLLDKPSLELLGLQTTGATSPIYAILSNEIATVREEAAKAKDVGMSSHLKIKLFGQPELDRQLIIAAREVYGPNGFIVGDPNYGYRKKVAPDKPLDDLAALLREYAALGLNAMEDPAAMTPQQWAMLQADCHPLKIIPDVPMRPSWIGIKKYKSDMSDIVNIHPKTTGSILIACDLANTVTSQGKTLMIGDDSFVGPGCPAFQQLAIALGAGWCESMEKPQENRLFQDCLTTSSPIEWDKAQSKLSVPSPRPGFGYELDAQKISQKAFAQRRFD